MAEGMKDSLNMCISFADRSKSKPRANLVDESHGGVATRRITRATEHVFIEATSQSVLREQESKNSVWTCTSRENPILSSCFQ
jgi:hypothetical protein